MTVNTTNITSGPYSGNDVATQFSFNFRADTKSQLAVYETDDESVQTLLTVDSDYTIIGLGVDAGGVVQRTAGALPSGYSWYIRSNYRDNQLTSLPSQGGFFPDVHESALDKLTFLIQQLNDMLGRSIRLDDADENGTLTALPMLTPNAFLQVNPSATGIQLFTAGVGPVTTEVPLASYDDFRNDASGFTVSNYSDGQVIYFTNQGVAGSFILRTGAVPPDNAGTVIRSNIDSSRYVERTYTGAASVKWFGAVGDGIVDDSAAIQNALASTTHIMFEGRSIYRVNTPIVITIGDVIEGEYCELRKYTTGDYNGVNCVLYLEGIVNKVRIRNLNLSEDTAVYPHLAIGVWANDGLFDCVLENMFVQGVYIGFSLGGGYQNFLRNTAVNVAYLGYIIDATLSTVSNFTSSVLEINASNVALGVELNRVIYSKLSGYIFNVETRYADDYAVGILPVAIKTNLCNSLNMNFGGETIEGIWHASTGSGGNATFFMAAGATEQFLPDGARINNGYSVAQQAYLSYQSSSWALIAPNFGIGHDTWTTPANPTTFANLGADAYAKFIAGNMIIDTTKVTINTGENFVKGWSADNTRTIGNNQFTPTTRTFNIGNGFAMHIESVFFTVPTQEHTIVLDFALDRIMFADTKVLRSENITMSSNLNSAINHLNDEVDFIFEENLNGYEVYFLVIGVMPVL